MAIDVAAYSSNDTQSDVVSLGRLLRHEQSQEFTTEDSYRSLSLYWDSRGHGQNSRAILSALFTQHRRITLQSISKVLNLEQEEREREVKGGSGKTPQHIQANNKLRLLASKDAPRVRASKSVLDIHRMTRRIQIKIRPHFSSSVEQLTASLLSDGIHERIRTFLAKVVDISHVRHRSQINNVQLLRGSTSNVYAWKPKERIREINTAILQKASLRSEKERQKLLQLGEHANKRKRHASDEVDEDLLIRAEKAREEEEERKLADAANEATRSALGEAKYLKWFTNQPKEEQSARAAPHLSGDVATHDCRREKDVVESISAANSDGYRGNISCVDVLTVLKSEKVLRAVWPRVIDVISASTFNSTS